MKKIILILASVFSHLLLNAQMNFNLILVVDQQIVVGSISDMRILLVKSNGDSESFPVDYYPGNLILDSSNYTKLSDTSIMSTYLEFRYKDYIGGEIFSNEYSIPFGKETLDYRYYVISIYNTCKKKYRKMFLAKSDKGYLYEILFPGNNATLIRRGRQ